MNIQIETKRYCPYPNLYFCLKDLYTKKLTERSEMVDASSRHKGMRRSEQRIKILSSVHKRYQMEIKLKLQFLGQLQFTLITGYILLSNIKLI